MKLQALALALACCVTMAGCTPLESNVENLMQPPQLTELQGQVDKALRDAVGGDFRLKYPSSGKHRSAFNFLDLDGNGADEAIAFYTDGDDSIQIAILCQTDGVWNVLDIVPGLNFCTEVDFLSVQKIGTKERVLVGWGGTGLANNLLSIYEYRSDPGSQASLFGDSRWDYSKVASTDMDQNGQSELLLLLSPDNYQNVVPLVNLVGENSDGIIDLLAEVELARNITGFYTPAVGKLNNSLYGAAVDCKLSDGTYSTVVLSYDGTNLVLPLSELSTENLYRQTVRRQEVLSGDLNGDGQLEIAVERLAPGYLTGDEGAVVLVDYCNLQQDSLTPVETAYVNIARGYQFLFPQRWRDQPVTVMAQPDNSEAIFFVSPTGDLYDHSQELFRLQVYSTLDGPDKLAQERFFQLGARGSYMYTAALPTEPLEELGLSRDEVQRLFSFIN